MTKPDDAGLSQAEMDGQGAAALPAREALSLLDLSADVNLALDIAAPIDAAVAANANAALPIDAAVSANVGSPDGEAFALADQASGIQQTLHGEATASALQDATVDQVDPLTGT